MFRNYREILIAVLAFLLAALLASVIGCGTPSSDEAGQTLDKASSTSASKLDIEVATTGAYAASATTHQQVLKAERTVTNSAGPTINVPTSQPSQINIVIFAPANAGAPETVLDAEQIKNLGQAFVDITSRPVPPGPK